MFTMKRMGNKGNVFVNFLWLLCFYALYFWIIGWGKWMFDTLGADPTLGSYILAMPDSAKLIMDTTLYVIIPIIAAGYTILASRQPQQPIYQY